MLIKLPCKYAILPVPLTSQLTWSLLELKPLQSTNELIISMWRKKEWFDKPYNGYKKCKVKEIMTRHHQYTNTHTYISGVLISIYTLRYFSSGHFEIACLWGFFSELYFYLFISIILSNFSHQRQICKDPQITSQGPCYKQLAGTHKTHTQIATHVSQTCVYLICLCFETGSLGTVVFLRSKRRIWQCLSTPSVCLLLPCQALLLRSDSIRSHDVNGSGWVYKEMISTFCTAAITQRTAEFLFSNGMETSREF